MNDAMTFGPETATDRVIASTLAEHPAVAAGLGAAHRAAWEVVDPIVLELCRLRIAQLLGNTAELAVRTSAAATAGLDEAMVQQLESWPTSAVFGTGQRACLAFCEQSLVDVSQITDEQTDAITAELGVQALADFVSALLVIEQRQRLCLTWTQLFGEQMPMPGETTTRRAAVTSRRTLDHERRIPVGVRADASLDRALATWQASVVVLDAVDPVTTELVRLRAAAHHDCRTCKSLRMVAGRDAGVDETMTAKIDRFENSDLPERHKVALRFADVMMTQPAHMSNELKLHLHQHFSDAELLELSLDVMKWNYQKVPVALRTDTEPAPGRLTMLAFDEQGRHHFM